MSNAEDPRVVLVVDDERAVRYALTEVLRGEGHTVVSAASGAEALDLLAQHEVAMVVTDLAMPGMDGLALLAAVRQRDPSLPVVLVTAHGDLRVAVQAMRAGAYDYIPKPFDNDHVAAVVARAVEAHRLRTDNRRLAAERALGKRFVAESPAMRRLLDAAARIATRDVTVLLRGEAGVGKELVGALLHHQSPRASKPLVRFNCAAIPGELAESELFGHVKGAFTGAHTARRGFFAEADGGTLILDEVGELTLGVQAKLLRVLQEGEIQPVGLGRVQKVDVRVVAATHRDLLAEAKAGRFREDLYYRLAVVELVIPPLRERRQDIPALAQTLLARYAERFGIAGLAFAPEVIDVLVRQEWPGNVRQLDNTIARLATLSPSDLIGLEDLAAAGIEAGPAPASPPLQPLPGALSGDALRVALPGASLRQQVDAFEAQLLAATLAETANNPSAAARRLQVSRVTLIDKLKKHGIV